MNKKITNNLSLKILSVAIAILIWLLVVNADNPIGTKSFVIGDVQLLNEAYLDADGKMCMQDDKQESIRVTIKANRKTLDRITASDIKAVADLQQAVSLNTDPVMVPITVSCDKVLPDNIEVTPKNLSIHIEDKDTQEFVVNVTTNNTKPDKGYEVGTLTSNPEKLKITGPTSLINKIDKVNASVDVDGTSEDVTEETDVKIIDKNGEEFTDTDMAYLNISKVSVTARLWKVRPEVRIKAEYEGTPADGYEVESISTTPNVISVAGSDEALSALEEQNNTVTIPSSATDVSGRDSDYEVKINISDYLSQGLKLTSDSSEDVFVRVNILPQGSSVCEVPTKNIKVENAPESMQVAFDTAKIEIRIKKTEEDLSDLKESDIKASIDLKDKTEGSFEVPVKIEIPEGYELVDEVTTGVEISPISTPAASN
nr:CdaR family protein [uncultured Blautia sp.]